MEDITNAKSGNAYQGKNLKALMAAMEDGGFTDPRFATYNDFKALGFWVKKGSKAAARITGMNGNYCVFNVAQTSMPVETAPVEQEQPEPCYEDAIVYNDPEEDTGSSDWAF